MTRNACNWFEIPADASPSIDAALARATAAGARMHTAKTALPPGMGFFAHIEDSEGNVVGLHSIA
jgi:predicted enzyme related to lactoylglutathione lyase